jgi:hypothetical protein
LLSSFCPISANASRARRPLKDEVLFCAQTIEQAVNLGPLQETAVLEDVLHRVGNDWRCHLKGFANFTFSFLFCSGIGTDIASRHRLVNRVFVHPGRKRQVRETVDRVAVFAEA